MAIVVYLVSFHCCSDDCCVTGAVRLIFGTAIWTCNVVYVFWNTDLAEVRNFDVMRCISQIPMCTESVRNFVTYSSHNKIAKTV